MIQQCNFPSLMTHSVSRKKASFLFLIPRQLYSVDRWFIFQAVKYKGMSSSSDYNNEVSNGKLATESSPAGMNSITNTVGMHPATNETSPPIAPSNVQRGSCGHPGCTTEHSGKQHE